MWVSNATIVRPMNTRSLAFVLREVFFLSLCISLFCLSTKASIGNDAERLSVYLPVSLLSPLFLLVVLRAKLGPFLRWTLALLA